MSGVKIKSLFKTHNPLRDQSIAVNARKMMNNRDARQHCDDIDKKFDHVTEATKGYNIGTENRVNEQVFIRKMANVSNRILKEGKELIFKDIFSSLVLEALIIDKPEVQKLEAGIREEVEGYIAQEGGYALLEAAVIKHPKVPLLGHIKAICEAAAKETTNRIRKEAEVNKDAVDPNYLNFNMTSEEKEKLDYQKAEIALPEISDLVSNKVMQVVKDEKQRAQDQIDLEEAIKAELTQEVGEEATTESFNLALTRRIIDKPVRESSTLFNSILRNTTKQTIQEKAVLEKSGSYDVKQELKDDEYFETGMDVMQNQLYNAPEDDNELDLILAESVLAYTILECASTIKLIDIGPKDIQKMSEHLLK